MRAAALHAVRALRVNEAFEPALQSLHHDDAVVRREAVGVLGYLKNPPAIGALTQAAVHDPDPEVRRVAVGALGYAGESSESASTRR